MKKAPFFPFYFFLFGSVTLMSCSPQVQISIAGNSKTDVHVTSKALPATSELIKSFNGLGKGTPVLNVEAIKASFTRAGFNQVQAVSSDGISLQIDAGAETVEKAFSSVAAGAIDYEPSSFQITLSSDTIPEILTLVPGDTIEYLDFLIAPLFTGERMSESDYKELIASVYGQTIARELSESAFELVINAPKAISSYEAPPQARVVRQGTRVTFTVPLTALLTEREKAVYRVEWK
jgi:hypothetical protein